MGVGTLGLVVREAVIRRPLPNTPRNIREKLPGYPDSHLTDEARFVRIETHPAGSRDSRDSPDPLSPTDILPVYSFVPVLQGLSRCPNHCSSGVASVAEMRSTRICRGAWSLIIAPCCAQALSAEAQMFSI